MCCIAIAVVACICVTASGYFMPKTAPGQISLRDDESAMQRFEVVGGKETVCFFLLNQLKIFYC
jgi:hypothetical protein